MEVIKLHPCTCIRMEQKEQHANCVVQNESVTFFMTNAVFHVFFSELSIKKMLLTHSNLLVPKLIISKFALKQARSTYTLYHNSSLLKIILDS